MSTDVAEIRKAARELAAEQGFGEGAVIAAGEAARLRLLGEPMHPARRELYAAYGTARWLNEHWSAILERAGIAEDPR
ncbi:hypothetical protein [Mycolicibacter virginiensis]|uniref:hypothetical protein n=1 Tax=Mycolicibacter virginiensis TaxID=1795032 RepID=UPI001F04EA2E|nr:hypothetical protein [Mycolicibacter virginiensis]ULP45887.1 hypothetical protein MJO54_13510 [Mycolicibacter virginiensis]